MAWSGSVHSSMKVNCGFISSNALFVQLFMTMSLISEFTEWAKHLLCIRLYSMSEAKSLALESSHPNEGSVDKINRYVYKKAVTVMAIMT